MRDFLGEYWVQLLVTAVGIVVTVLVSYWLYRRQIGRLSSALVERRIRAHEALLDMLETRVVSQSGISLHFVRTLRAATERRFGVSLSSVSPISLLEDIALRLESSRHLDLASKEKLGVQLEQFAEEFGRESALAEPQEKLIAEMLDTLESSVRKGATEEALKQLRQLRENRYPTVEVEGLLNIGRIEGVKGAVQSLQFVLASIAGFLALVTGLWWKGAKPFAYALMGGTATFFVLTIFLQIASLLIKMPDRKSAPDPSSRSHYTNES